MAQRLDLEQLDDRTVMLILSYLTVDLQERVPEEAAGHVVSQEDAERMVAALLVQTGDMAEGAAVAADVPQREEVAATARQVLAVLAKDPGLRPQIEEMVAHPPEDEQMSVEAAIAGAVLLGFVVSWLQTNANIVYSRKNGKTEFTFSLKKEAADKSTVEAVAKSVAGLFSGRP